MRPLVVIRNQPSCPLGALEDVLVESSIPWRYVDCWREETIPDLGDVCALIVLGGAMNVDQIREYPHLGTVRELVRDAVTSGAPVMGICLGAQIITRALNADVFRSPKKEAGFVEVRATDAGLTDPVLSLFGPSSLVFQFHEDSCELPPDAELLFEGSEVPVQAFRAGERAYAIQFHLEVTETEIATWCDETHDLEDAWGVSKDELLTQAKEHLATQQVLGRKATERFLSLI